MTQCTIFLQICFLSQIFPIFVLSNLRLDQQEPPLNRQTHAYTKVGWLSAPDLARGLSRSSCGQRVLAYMRSAGSDIHSLHVRLALAKSSAVKSSPWYDCQDQGSHPCIAFPARKLSDAWVLKHVFTQCFQGKNPPRGRLSPVPHFKS